VLSAAGVMMEKFWGACFGRCHGGGSGDPAEVVAVPAPASGSAGPSRPPRHEDAARPSAGVVPGTGPDASPPAAAAVDVKGDTDGGSSSVASAGGDCPTAPVDAPTPGSSNGARSRPGGAADGHADTGTDAPGRGDAASAVPRGRTGGDPHAHDVGGGGGTGGSTSAGDAGGGGVREAARGRGYPIITFTVRSRVPGTLEVANGTKVHACLGRDAYVLWRTPRGGVPASEDDFRKARPACIRLERGGVGALRAATAAEAEGAAVPHTDCLLFMKGTDLSAASEVSVVTLLLEAPSAAVCTAWAAAGLSLLTPLDELLATGAGEAVSSARVDQVVRAVLPPLPASKGDQPNMVCRMLGRRGRRFVLNAQHWLTPATPVARVGATAIGAGADLVDQLLLPAPIVGPALRFGLVVAQLGALAVLAAGHAARCETVVGRCEGVACDLLDRIFAELRGSLTKFTAAYVKQLCLLMVEVEEVLEEIERMYFSPTLDADAVDRWELRLKGIGKDKITSSVLAAVGHTTDEIRRKASGIQNELSIRRKHVATTVEEPDLSDYEVGWRPPVLDGNYVAGVDSPGRAEHTIVAILEQWDRRAAAPRVGVCAIGGSGKSTACAGVAACKQVRALCSRGVIWVQLNESSTMETLSTTAVALVYRLCGEAKAKHLLRLVNRDNFLEMAAGYLRAAEVTDSSEWLLIFDDVRDDQTRLLHQLLRVVPSATPVLFTTRSDVAVASVTGAERVLIDSLPDGDARVLLAQALGKRPAAGEPVFSQAEEDALVGPVL